MKAEPIELPLPGTKAGATVRLHPLLTGEVLAPDALLHRSGGPMSSLRAIGVGVPKSDRVWIPAPAFLVEHPGAGPLLVDTGLHADTERGPRDAMGAIASRMYEFRGSAELDLKVQMKARGVDAADLSLIVMTHLDTDHASGISQFPGSTVLVDRREWRAASSPLSFKGGYHRPHLDQPVEWRTLEYGSSAASPYGPFQSTFDLFGDGSVRLVSTPGHTRGHQSVLLRLEGREALIAADAAYTTRTIREGVLPGLTRGGRKAFERSLTEIRSFVEHNPDALVVPGHDAAAWASLRPAY